MAIEAIAWLQHNMHEELFTSCTISRGAGTHSEGNEAAERVAHEDSRAVHELSHEVQHELLP